MRRYQTREASDDSLEQKTEPVTLPRRTKAEVDADRDGFERDKRTLRIYNSHPVQRSRLCVAGGTTVKTTIPNGNTINSTADYCIGYGGTLKNFKAALAIAEAKTPVHFDEGKAQAKGKLEAWVELNTFKI